MCSNVKVSVKLIIYGLQWLTVFLIPVSASTQQRSNDSILQNATLENVVRYAVERNPELRNALLDEEITETLIKGRLADWYPQLNFNYTLQRNFQLPIANINSLR